MLSAIMRPIQKSRAQSPSVPSPVSGWNTKDPLGAMSPTFACVLDNWYPDTDGVHTRPGSAKYATGLPGAVESLMSYAGTKLFAASVTALYDVTNSGAVAAAVVSGLTNARWQHANIAVSGVGTFMYAVNGADAPRVYNGAAFVTVTGVSTPALTNPPTAGLSSLVNVGLYQGRLFFTEINSLRAYYLPIAVAGGALALLDLGGMFKLGGTLLGMWPWTIDGGNGPQDYAAFVSSEGEVVVFQGNDPSVAANWVLKGTYRIGRPVGGYRCAFRFRGEPTVICSDGLLPMPVAASRDDAGILAVALSANISTAFVDSAAMFASNFGWCGAFCPDGSIFVNIPTVYNSQSYQYVMNTNTNAWCRFTGIVCNCMEIFNGFLHIGGNTNTTKFGTGSADNGANIVCDAQPAWSMFGAAGANKQWQTMRLLLSSPSPANIAAVFNTDFKTVTPQSNPAPYGAALAQWNITHWNTTLWYGGIKILRQWLGINGVGYWGTPYVRVVSGTNSGSLTWFSTDYEFTVGGPL